MCPAHRVGASARPRGRTRTFEYWSLSTNQPRLNTRWDHQHHRSGNKGLCTRTDTAQVMHNIGTGSVLPGARFSVPSSHCCATGEDLGGAAPPSASISG